MDLELGGKVALVTGASRGIGRAIAETLAGEGMRLALVARSRERLDEIAASLGTPAIVVAVDLREPGSGEIVVSRALDAFGAIDLLVNNAGATKRGDFLELAEEEWADGFALKLFGAVRCSRAAWPHLAARGGAIVNVVGIGGRTASAEFTIGGSVNAALLNFTKALADRGVADGIRVNAVNPSAIATDRLRTRVAKVASERGLDEREAARELASALGVSRFGEPEEIARVVAFLASPAAAGYCQGAILDVDGGKTRTL